MIRTACAIAWKRNGRRIFERRNNDAAGRRARMRLRAASTCSSCARPDGGELPEFSAGAHVAVKVPNGLIRKYSLCNDPAERDRYQIAVKRERGRPRRIGQPDRKHQGRRRADRLAAGQRFRTGAQCAGVPLHRRRHRHHADHVDDARAQCDPRQAIQALLLHALAGIHRVPRRAERACIRRQSHHPSRRRRSRARARPLADRRGAQEPRASLLLRSAPTDAGRARHDRTLVVGRHSYGSVQRSRDAQARRQAVQRDAREIRRDVRGAGRRHHPRSDARAQAIKCRVHAKAAPAAPAARNCSPARPIIAISCSPNTSAPTRS